MHLRTTRDGSSTLYSERYGQHYHNPNGALGESRHVFLRPLSLLPDMVVHRPLTIFETGFGTGLNLLLLLSARQTLASRSPIHYLGCEPEPADSRLLLQMNHARALGLQAVWERLVEGLSGCRPGWNRLECGLNGVRVSLFLGTLQEIPGLPTGPDLTRSAGHAGHDGHADDAPLVDHVFHDPFSPDASPECWSAQAFSRLLSWTSPRGTLRTYGAATRSRAAMAQAGWAVARAPGAMGKREMTLAAPSAAALAPYPVLDRERLLAKLHPSDRR